MFPEKNLTFGQFCLKDITEQQIEPIKSSYGACIADEMTHPFKQKDKDIWQ